MARFVDLKQDSPEWKIWRSSGLGASDAAAVLGVCKFKTPYQLFLEKTNRVPAFEGNAYTEAGKTMEPKARASFEIENDFIEMTPMCVMHPTHDFILASLDGLSPGGSTILEIKYVSEATHKLALDGAVPEHYFPQTQHQLMCVPEAEFLYYYSYREGNATTVIVKRDNAFIEKLETALIGFWDLVKSDTPPPLTYNDAKLIIGNKEIEDICKELIVLKASDVSADKAKSDDLKARVIELGKHNKVRCNNVLVAHSKTKSGKDSYRLTISGGSNV